MILISLTATNFKKFRQIDLRDLPSQGLVGVVGPNEGGKSTVIDAMTFALFARTAVSDKTGFEALIHWEEDVCQVEMVFEAGGRRFRIFREIDRMGDHLAQLEELDGITRPGNVAAEAAAVLSLDDVDRSRAINGPVRVARAIKKLLGYTFDDFRHSFYLAQSGGDPMASSIATGGTPDWGGVLFRMTGIAAMEKAVQKAHGVAESIHTEVRQVEGELEVQGRVLGAMGVTADDEARLRDELEEIERDLSAEDAARTALLRKQQEVRVRLEHRRRANRELGGLALAMLEEHVAADVSALALGLGDRRDSLARERASVEIARGLARDRTENVGRLRQMLEELDRRLADRRTQLDSELSSEHPESLVDERDANSREIRVLAGRGRGAIGAGIFLLILAATGGAVLALGTDLVQMPPPLLPQHVRWGTIAVAALGFLFIATGGRARRRGQALASVMRDRLEELDQQIAMLMSEREVLSGDAINVARDARAARIHDERIRSVIRQLSDDHREFLDRAFSVDEYAADLRRKVEDQDLRLRHLDATAERLERVLALAQEQAKELEVLLQVSPVPARLDDVDLGTLEERLAQLKQRSIDLSRRLDNDRRPVVERMAVLHDEVDPFGAEASARLQDLDRLLDGPEKSRPGVERTLVAKVDALIATLPSEQELVAEVESAGAGAQGIERKLAELDTRLTERRRELERMTPQFDRRRTVEEEIDSLGRKVEELRQEAEHEMQAAKLLRGASDQLRSRLAPSIGRSLGRRLGRITGGRYTRVSVDLEFGLHIYSDERNAFVDPLELSGGTHDQLLLSLRLAFAEVLLAARGRGDEPHMLLLDEPLDGFDAARTSRFIALLRDGDSALSQVFLLAAQEEVGASCDMTVRTAQDDDRLSAGGAPSSPLTQSVTAHDWIGGAD